MKRAEKGTKEDKRNILIMLANRFDPKKKVRYLELECNSKGDILRERPLKGRPSKPVYDEVWENDEGRESFASCHRFRRFYGHALQKKA